MRQRILPAVVFGCAVIGIGLLWKDHTSARIIVGQAEPVLSNVSCYKPGVLAELNVNRFQRVKKGDPIGRVMVTEPRILTSSLAVIQAEIESLRANMKPVAVQQQNVMDFDQLQLDWMKERTQLASAKVNLELAGTVVPPDGRAIQRQIVSERVYDQAKATQGSSAK